MMRNEAHFHLADMWISEIIISGEMKPFEIDEEPLHPDRSKFYGDSIGNTVTVPSDLYRTMIESFLLAQFHELGSKRMLL